jgi:spermidine dehydrogenase
MDRDITRRDFLGATLLGTGAMLLNMPAPIRGRLREQQDGMIVPDWGSYGGVGDYANSYGNTETVLRAAHAVRTGAYRVLSDDVVDTGETYDLVIVGGGFSGLGAAYEFKRQAAPGQTCLVLDNHPIFGGEAKRNEFVVDGMRLIGPQGSNGTVAPRSRVDVIHEFHADLGIPMSFQFQDWDAERFKPLEFARENYGFMLWGDASENNGYFFDETHGTKPAWTRDIWRNGMDGTPWSEDQRRDLLAWRRNTERPHTGSDFERWLDSMTLQQYVEDVLGHGPHVSEFLHPIVASGLGLGADVLSAYRAYASGIPGFDGFAARPQVGLEDMPWLSFPGGNTGLARFFAKWLIPDAIPGGRRLEDVITRPVNFEALDRAGQSVRMRLASTVVHVRNDPAVGGVVVAYTHDGRAHMIRARAVVMASGSWMNRQVVIDAPAALQRAWAGMTYASILSVNVALTNWRFLYDLDVTCCRWFSGFGFSGNIRRPMVFGDHDPPLDPNRPTVFTMYVPFVYPGQPAAEQGRRSRAELVGTSYAEYERRIREQLQHLFGSAGFKPRDDIAGIILNRWGHAYVVATPGFHFGTPDAPTASDVIRAGHDRIRFGHSELNGHQRTPTLDRRGDRRPARGPGGAGADRLRAGRREPGDGRRRLVLGSLVCSPYRETFGRTGAPRRMIADR